MENLVLEGSAKTPTVNFDSDNGVLELKGRSIPENSIEFYKPLNDWIDAYAANPKPNTIVDVKLEYFNTSSSKCILDLFKQLEKLNAGNTEVSVNWYFEEDDEDMEEAGEDYQAIIDLPFKMIEVEEI
ncbi:DUF1987 domain-containing protein [Paracrocinitomix mangrovi]|uniref:DUF1987 domain-containing protein n=1 Tax=Paracrocinitomix mangrovi TaxID=2862509 RepID=UPI001C8E7F7B|nr:DUF1987 domain-containing protein [Paracrocinitomix mangrovi]UKN02976.1 DUF1987 domain-containing protein [Paracrocinitomix mangrovi]